MGDEERMSLQDLAVAIETDTARLPWGKVLLTSDTALTLEAMRAIDGAHNAIVALLKWEDEERAAAQSAH